MICDVMCQSQETPFNHACFFLKFTNETVNEFSFVIHTLNEKIRNERGRRHAQIAGRGGGGQMPFEIFMFFPPPWV